MALVVGLDIGTRSLTGAVFAGTPKKLRLIDFFREEIPALDASKPAIGPAAHGEGGKEGTVDSLPELSAPLSIEELIQKVLTERNLKAADFVVALDAKDCIIREIPVAFTRDEQIAKVVPFEAENYLPTLNVEDIILEYLKVGEKAGKSQVVLFGMRQDLVESRLGMLKRVDVDPVALDLDATALFNAFAATPIYNPAKSTLLVDMGGTSTKIVLIEGGALKKVRAFRSAPRALSPDRMLAQPAAVGAGGGAAGAALAQEPFEGYSLEARFQEIENALKRLEPTIFAGGHGDDAETAPIAILSAEDFERVQERAAEAERAAAAAAAAGGPKPRQQEAGNEGFRVRSYLERLELEIQRTLASAAAPLELICLTGGLSGHEEACRFFNEQFDVETIRLDFGSAGDTFPAESGIAMDEVSRYGAVAVGLALKELGYDKTGLDFRKGRFRYEHRFTRLQYPLLVLSAMAFAFFLQTAFWAWHSYETHTNRAMLFDAQSRAAYKEFFGKPAAEGRDPKSAAEDQRDRWKGKGGGDLGRFIPAMESIKDFTQTLNGANLGHFTIKSMNFSFGVQTAVVGGKKTSALKDSGSSVELMTKDSRAHLTLESKFRDRASKWWEAEASSVTLKDEYKVSLKLKAKAAALKELE
jgi:Tfp pilus assembly PilM family ATPase